MVRKYHATLDLVSEAALAGLSDLVEQAKAYAEAVRDVDPDGDILDLGSGVGLPGVVIAATFPKQQVWLVERRRRRATFLKMVVAELGLDHAVVVESDVTDIQRDELGFAESGLGSDEDAGRSDVLDDSSIPTAQRNVGMEVITAQAVASFAEIYCLTRHLHGAKVTIVSRKGPGWPNEVKALSNAIGAVPAVLGEPVSIGGGTLVGIEVRGGLPCLRSA